MPRPLTIARRIPKVMAIRPKNPEDAMSDGEIFKSGLVAGRDGLSIALAGVTLGGKA
jgi:hypothetical protein